MQFITSLLATIKRHPLISFTTLLLIVVIVQVLRSTNETELVVDTSSRMPVVSLVSSADLSGTSQISSIGTVRAFASGAITAERGGRVVSVPVTLGQRVAPGQVIVQLESATERAALMQAEGAFAAAQAAASQGIQQNDSGVRNAEAALRSAENNVVSAVQASFGTANNALVSTVDQFYSNPLSMNPGIRISRTNTTYLRQERIAFQAIIDDWRAAAQSVTYTESTLSTLASSEVYTERLLQVVDHLIAATTQADAGDTLAGQPVTTFTAILIQERSALVGSLQTIRSARIALTQATEARARAEIGDTSSQAALSDAQVQQARGGLEAARANLAKTTLRTPIAGTINTLSVQAGDFISPSTLVAAVANNDALEVVTFISVSERDLVSIGDVVTLDTVATGTIVAISPAVDPVTRKIEVRIAAADSARIKNGDTVTVTARGAAALSDTTTFTLPLTAVRFNETDGFVYIVDEQRKLLAIPVKLGAVRGSTITITDGIAFDQVVVADARGLVEGDEVTVRN